MQPAGVGAGPVSLILFKARGFLFSFFFFGVYANRSFNFLWLQAWLPIWGEGLGRAQAPAAITIA